MSLSMLGDCAFEWDKWICPGLWEVGMLLSGTGGHNLQRGW